MLHLSLTKQVRKGYQPKRTDIQKWLRQSLLYTYKNITLDVSIVNSIISAELNQQYRQKNYSTNVISLEYANTRDEFAMLSGELILCDEVIVKEAGEQNKTVIAHYAHMVVHGMLHLQGLDHQNDAEAEYMEGLESKIMNGLGFPNPY